MKRKLTTLLISFILVSNFVFGQYSERDWHWEPYATLQKNQTVLMVVYYGTLINGYNGTVRWRIENKSSKSIFKASLMAQKYILKDSTVINKPQVNFKTRIIKTGKSAMTLPFTIESAPYKKLKEVEVTMPICVISLGSDGEYEWNRLGKIVLDDF